VTADNQKDKAQLIEELSLLRETVARLEHAANASKASEHFLKETQRIARIGSWKVNPHTDYLEWTEGVYDILEAPKDYRPKLSEGIQFFLPLYVPVLMGKITECLATGEPFRAECEAVTATGKKLWTEVRGLMPLTEGQESFVLATFQDITDRKRAEERDKHFQILRETLSSLDEAVLIVDTETRQIYDCNNVAEKMFGYSREELIGKTSEFLHVNEESFRLFGETVAEELTHSDHYDFEFQMRRFNGDIFPTGHYGHPIVTGQSSHFVVSVVRDMTAKKRAEEAQHRQSDILSKVLESVPNLMMLVDKEGRIEYINRAGAEAACRPRESLLGLLCGEVFSCLNSFEGISCGKNAPCKECPVRTRVDHTFQTGEPIYEEEGRLEIRKNDKTESWHLLISTALLKTKDKEQVLLTIADITDRKRAEDALRESEEKAKQLAHENAIMAEIGRIISSSLNIENVYNRFAEKVKELLPFDRIAIAVANLNEGVLSFPYVEGVSLPEIGRASCRERV
jgi:PAS domain S-box-containing protein